MQGASSVLHSTERQPHAGANATKALQQAVPKVMSLYKGVLGAASGAGIYIGTYFAVYGAATNMLSQHSAMKPGARAFVAGGTAAPVQQYGGPGVAQHCWSIVGADLPAGPCDRVCLLPGGRCSCHTR